MLNFEKSIIKKFWPADDKGENDEIVRQLVLQVEAELDNSIQVGELFNNMVRGLTKVSFLDNHTGEEYILPAVTIKPFNVKQKKIKIGKGEDAEVVRAEYASMNLVTKIPNEKGGKLLSEIFDFFNIDIQMIVEPYETLKAAQEDEPDESEDFEEPDILGDFDETDDQEDDM